MLDGEDKMIELVEIEVRIFYLNMNLMKITPQFIKGSAPKSLEGDAKHEEKILELMNAVDIWILMPIKEFDNHS